MAGRPPADIPPLLRDGLVLSEPNSSSPALPLSAEIVAIGTELTTGEKLDTNSQWLSLALADLGIPVRFHTTIGDDLKTNVDVLRLAVERADVVIVSGGLGPTLDDLTREALAQLQAVPLVLHPESLEAIESYFRKRGRPMPERNRVQAMFPETAAPLPNPVGTAPGIWMTVARAGREACQIAALPGVPSELYRMFRDQVAPRLPQTGTIIRRKRIHSFGLGEAQVDEVLKDVTARGRDPEVGITAHQATITLRINAPGQSVEECERKIAETSRIIEERLGEYIFGTEDDELEHAVLRLLAAGRKTLAVVESGTKGALAARLADLDDGTHFRQGITLPEQQWIAHEPTRTPLAPAKTEELARWIRATTGADFALAVSPYRVPPTLSADPEIAYVVLDGGGTIVTERVLISGNPEIQQARVVKTALDLLRRRLR
ncbi:Putative competence-damage inducible protein [Planctomyces sp. SH-PL14]|nr:Putative competence-damage inducible protein [Planctomyces sp. SH-PL14]